MFSLGYGTNGFSNHRLEDALRIIADIGYRSVALTLDHHHLDPFDPDVSKKAGQLGSLLASNGISVVIETGARYLLDPNRKHHPTLVSSDTDVRIDFLHRAIRIAQDMGAEAVSYWSGIKPSDVDDKTAHQRMLSGVEKVLVEADRRQVKIGLEPEPGMYIQHLAQALALREELGNPEMFGITLDVGHCIAVEPMNAAECIRQAGGLLVNVQLDDMRPGVHEHLEFGEGELDLVGTLAALAEVGYEGVAAVELPRHSHAAPEVARRVWTALTSALSAAMPPFNWDWVGHMDHPWLVDAERRVRSEPAAIRALFPAVGRKVGRDPLRPESDPQGLVHGTVDDLARTRLLAALAEVLSPEELTEEITELYRYGDDGERRGVLRGLPALPPQAVKVGLELVQDALRTNDIRLVAAALGSFAGKHLDPHSWRHGVLKCLFVGVPLAAVADLERRTDPELLRMIADYADERRAAGREVPADAVRLLEVN
ncbi:EboA domain-containing protein [Kibdelosporangium aridum]|nr:EboA domain-containing protein [Kibdelosporangium aridum]